jgi:hypothetical protein
LNEPDTSGPAEDGRGELVADGASEQLRAGSPPSIVHDVAGDVNVPDGMTAPGTE